MVIYARKVSPMMVKWYFVWRPLRVANSPCLLRCSYTSCSIESLPISKCEKHITHPLYSERKFPKRSRQPCRKSPTSSSVTPTVNNAEASKVQSTDYTLALPTDMSSIGALDLLALPCGSSGISYLRHPLLPLRTKPDSLHKLEKLVFQILTNGCGLENDTHLNIPQKINCSSNTQGDKNIEPADDPKQKIRLLHSKLRQQLPMYFSKGSAWHDFSIYKQTVQLIIIPKRYKNKITCRGLGSYKRAAMLYRNTCKFCLREPRLEVLSLTSFEDKKTIEVRWRTVGMPYYLHILSYLMPALRSKFIKYYDYASVFYLDENCKVYCHEISKLQSSPGPVRSIAISLRKRVPAAAMTPIVGKNSLLKK